MPGQSALYSDAPLLHVRARRPRIYRANSHPAQIQLGWVEKVRRKAVAQEEHGRSGVRCGGRHIVDQERRIESHLVFAAVPLKQLVEDSIARAQDRVVVNLERKADAWGKVVAVGVHQGAIFQRAALCQKERPGSGGIEVGDMVLAFHGRSGKVISETEVQREPAAKLEIVLREAGSHE